MEKYYATDDRNRRLHRSICMYDGHPVWVVCSDPYSDRVPSDEEVFICPLEDSLKSSKYILVKYTDDKFVARAYPLGYLNHRDGATFIGRAPHQQQKQGCHTEVIINLGGESLPSSYMHTIGMVDCILGKYPSFDIAVKLSYETAHSVAFDRHFAVVPGHKRLLFLHFRGRPCGLITKETTVDLFDGRETRLIVSLLKDKGIIHEDNKRDLRSEASN